MTKHAIKPFGPYSSCFIGGKRFDIETRDGQIHAVGHGSIYRLVPLHVSETVAEYEAVPVRIS